ncbi:hypothetical protein ABH940_006857 [Streptacidiphilus sp. BW17]|uniref:TniQ family protein n=1 Tax=Streptacidiphilus sp. BW17 TaxID=3156274 RepID=UPI003513E6F3
MQFESTASYLHRLAHAYRLTLPQLLDGLHITTRGRPANNPGTGTTEIRLTPAAQQHLATFTRTPAERLAQALPRLSDTAPRPARARHHSVPATGPALAAWYPPDPDQQPVPSCPACTLRHTAGTTGHALAYLPDHLLHCPHHRYWSTRHHALDVHTQPDLTTSQHHHRRLLRHPAGAASLTWAQTITTRWYDHQQHPALTRRWTKRLNQLTTTNPQAAASRPSLTHLARQAVTYPETITLARHLAHARITTTPTPHPKRHTDPATTHFLTHLAHHLHLTALHPHTSDPLWNWIHHHTQR